MSSVMITASEMMASEMSVAKCNHNKTFCGSATHQMAPPIYYWSTDALNGACAKSLSSTKNGKEEGSSSCGDLGH
ncbi:hypothetical protein AVEN_217709-1 [Araneus ventricosus]|uniref:Uncharacterized protein n=1 Tax=Araneus ventricosus TaxID=182803 RepID=A0A4Y2SCP6_ARAVE|nr:hypothetical protein AVEN_217709-1 [Araneus ventricosus]